jgi:hypothetical protein
VINDRRISAHSIFPYFPRIPQSSIDTPLLPSVTAHQHEPGKRQDSRNLIRTPSKPMHGYPAARVRPAARRSHWDPGASAVQAPVPLWIRGTSALAIGYVPAQVWHPLRRAEAKRRRGKGTSVWARPRTVAAACLSPPPSLSPWPKRKGRDTYVELALGLGQCGSLDFGNGAV